MGFLGNFMIRLELSAIWIFAAMRQHQEYSSTAGTNLPQSWVKKSLPPSSPQSPFPQFVTSLHKVPTDPSIWSLVLQTIFQSWSSIFPQLNTVEVTGFPRWVGHRTLYFRGGPLWGDFLSDACEAGNRSRACSGILTGSGGLASGGGVFFVSGLLEAAFYGLWCLYWKWNNIIFLSINNSKYYHNHFVYRTRDRIR